MCGIAGAIGSRDQKLVPSMLGRLAHRGPDDEGVWQDATRGISLGHRRLSIIDLSSAGHQPMESEDGSIVVVFNGEIYNYKLVTEELRQKGYSFRSSSDTEVLLHGYREWGADVFKKIDGMWAIALYDKKQQLLFLSRDPAGVKPLYVYRSRDMLAFSSEVQALKAALPKGSLSVDDTSMAKFLSHGYIYGNGSVYKEITQIPPAMTITISLPSLTEIRETHYVPTPMSSSHSLDAAVGTFTSLFTDSVRDTIQADVPVGLFLSGGIDSSLIAYHLQSLGAKLRAFTLGFGERTFDESATASRIAESLGFPHEVISMSDDEVANDALTVLDAFGAPFADMAALPTYALSRRAKETGTKVVLTGDGADELFGGYQTHYLPALTRHYQRMPQVLDRALHGAARLLPVEFEKLGHREKLTRFLHAARDTVDAAHAKWKYLFTDAELAALVTPGARETYAAPDFAETFEALRVAEGKPDEDLVLKVDFKTFLPGSCLVKSDIMSMQHGVEIRVPFLNKPLIDFAWHLPLSLKASPFHTKKILRRALAQYLPKDIARLPKRGFVPPMAHWLAGPLRPLMQELLSKESLAKTGFLKYDAVALLIGEHLAGKADHTKKLWALMSLSRFYTHE